MKKNVGTIDKIVRILIAALIAGLYFANVITGTLAVILLIVAGIFVLTSACSVCPLYKPFGLTTTKEKE